MEIRDLDYFLTCCTTGSFTAAARQAHIVQSAMSAAIARLEREARGLPLRPLRRPGHRHRARSGAAAGAQRILEAVQAARDEVAAVSGRVRGTVILGSTLHTGPLDLAAVLAGLRDRHPGVIVHLRQSLAGSAGNLQAVLDGAMDITLTASAADTGHGRPPRGVILTPLVSEPLVFVCPAGHPRSDRRLAWHLSAAVSATRQPTAAATALLTALTQAAAALPQAAAPA